MSGAARVGYVLEGYPRPSETFVVTEILAREAYGESIVVFRLRAPEPDPHGLVARVKAVVVDVPGATDAAQADALAHLARLHGVSHLHAHFANTATTVARLASLSSDLTYSFTAHAMDIFSPVADPADLAAKIRDASFVVTVSDFNLAHLRSLAPDARGLLRLYNGLDLDRFPFTPRPFADSPAKVLAVGRLVEKKGFRHVIDAVGLLRERGENVTLDIVGSGTLHVELAERIAASGHSTAMRLLGAKPQHEVAALLREADAFVVPSVVASNGDAEGLPTVLLEAMATGAPCVATAVTGIPEVIRTGETGILVPPADPPALAEAIARTVSTDYARMGVITRARELIERQFDVRRQALDLIALSSTAR